MKTYKVYIKVVGWIDIGSVQATDDKEAMKLGEQLDHEFHYDGNDCEDLVEFDGEFDVEVE
jgi:hypothetical protein